MGGYHLVDGLHDGQHLVVGDLAVAVDVVELEGPVQLVLHLAPRRDGQRADELLKVDDAAVVGVEDAEDVVGKGRGVAKGEELAVDLLELLLGERAGRAVLEETCTRSTYCSSRWCRGPGAYVPLYHCCSSFLSKWVAFCSSSSSAAESFDCLRHHVSRGL